MKYRCGTCGYIYDEDEEGVPFADLPDDWICPICGEPKSEFSPVERFSPSKPLPDNHIYLSRATTTTQCP